MGSPYGKIWRPALLCVDEGSLGAPRAAPPFQTPSGADHVLVQLGGPRRADRGKQLASFPSPRSLLSLLVKQAPFSQPFVSSEAGMRSSRMTA